MLVDAVGVADDAREGRPGMGLAVGEHGAAVGGQRCLDPDPRRGRRRRPGSAAPRPAPRPAAGWRSARRVRAAGPSMAFAPATAAPSQTLCRSRWRVKASLASTAPATTSNPIRKKPRISGMVEPRSSAHRVSAMPVPARRVSGSSGDDPEVVDVHHVPADEGDAPAGQHAGHARQRLMPDHADREHRRRRQRRHRRRPRGSPPRRRRSAPPPRTASGPGRAGRPAAPPAPAPPPARRWPRWRSPARRPGRRSWWPTGRAAPPRRPRSGRSAAPAPAPPRRRTR